MLRTRNNTNEPSEICYTPCKIYNYLSKISYEPFKICQYPAQYVTNHPKECIEPSTICHEPSEIWNDLLKYVRIPLLYWRQPKYRLYMYIHIRQITGDNLPVVARPTGGLIFVGHFSPKSPIISGSFAENDLQLKKSCGSSPSCTCACT